MEIFVERISAEIFARDIRQRPGPEGREMAQAASVSAAKTPTAEPVSEGFGPEGTKAPSVAAPSRKRKGSESCRRSRRARQSGSARRDGTDTHGLASGGSGTKMCCLGTFFVA